MQSLDELAVKLMNDQLRKRKKLLNSESVSEYTKNRNEKMTLLSLDHFKEIAAKILEKEQLDRDGNNDGCATFSLRNSTQCYCQYKFKGSNLIGSFHIIFCWKDCHCSELLKSASSKVSSAFC